MKVVILCGGLGSRLSEETRVKPKPMVKIGSKPILIHIMEIYKKYGFNEFILAAGYKFQVIKKYFNKNRRFNVKVINTGQKSLTGKRIYRLKKLLQKEKDFMLTYGDGLSDINLNKLLSFHKKHKKISTLTSARPPARFGAIKISGNQVTYFKEKSKLDEGWINGGFFVFEPEIFKFINGDRTYLEREPLQNVSKKKQL